MDYVESGVWDAIEKLLPSISSSCLEWRMLWSDQCETSRHHFIRGLATSALAPVAAFEETGTIGYIVEWEKGRALRIMQGVPFEVFVRLLQAVQWAKIILCKDLYERVFK